MAEKKSNKSSNEKIICTHFEGLIDIVEKNSKCVYLILNNNNLEIKERVKDINNNLLVPPDIRDVPFMLPRADKVIKAYKSDNNKKLYKDIVKYFKDNTELSEEIHYELFAIWVIHTYLLDRLNFSPFIWLSSPYGTGKSRTGKSLVYISRRGIHTPCVRVAFLTRYPKVYHHSTVFIDVVDIMKNFKYQESQDAVLLRCEKGARVIRINNPKDPSNIDFYDVFGATIVATNKQPNQYLMTRSISITMSESKRIFHHSMTEDYARGYRERLLGLRARLLNKEVPKPDKFGQGRTGDLFVSLRQVAEMLSPVLVKRLYKIYLLHTEEAEEELSSDIDSFVVEAIVDCKDRVIKHKLKGKDIDILSIKDIVSRLNYIMKEDKRFTPIGVGMRLKNLGFKKIRKGSGMYIIFDKNKILELGERYCIKKILSAKGVYRTIRPKYTS